MELALGQEETRTHKVPPVGVWPLVITYTILGIPYYGYSIMGPKTLF